MSTTARLEDTKTRRESATAAPGYRKSEKPSTQSPQNLIARIEGVDWRGVEASLDTRGFAPLPPLLTAGECDALAALYQDDARFRSRIEMERFRFGAGEYKYFAAPLPPIVQALRTVLYGRLAPVANRWAVRLTASAKATAVHRSLARRRKPDAMNDRYPETLDAFLARCHKAGQRRPTPLLLSYTEGGYNCLHQDIYGEVAFPLQVVFVLDRVVVDYTGGEFLLVEQRPRAQSRGYAMTIEQGAGVVFSTRERPAAGTRGTYRVVMRHGVSTLTSGARMSLGIIFHDGT